MEDEVAVVGAKEMVEARMEHEDKLWAGANSPLEARAGKLTAAEANLVRAERVVKTSLAEANSQGADRLSSMEEAKAADEVNSPAEDRAADGGVGAAGAACLLSKNGNRLLLAEFLSRWSILSKVR
jgi:hypothetical protein